MLPKNPENGQSWAKNGPENPENGKLPNQDYVLVYA